MTHNTPVNLGICGIAILSASGYLSYQAYAWAGIAPNVLGAIWTMCVFTAAVDTVITSALLGVHGVGQFYNAKGEKYVQSCVGAALFGWDGTFHLVVQLHNAFLLMTGRGSSLQFKFGALVWAGSIGSSMMPYMLGAFSGPFAKELELSSALNLPYVFFPGIVARQVMASVPSRKRSGQSMLAWAATLLAVAHVTLACVHLLRALVVVGSEAPLAAFWAKSVEPVLVDDRSRHILFLAMQWAFIMAPYHVLCASDLITRGALKQSGSLLEPYAADLAALAVGAYGNGLFFYCIEAAFDWVGLGQPLKLAAHAPPPAFWLLNVGTMAFVVAYFVFVK